MTLAKLAALNLFLALASTGAVNAAPSSGATWAVVAVSIPASPQPASDAQVFVTITNPSSSVHAVSEQYLCNLVDLFIWDSKGNRVAPNVKNCPRFGESRPQYHYSLAPGATWRGRPEEQAGQKLSAWGYNLPPGTYTIEVAPSDNLYYDPSGASPPPSKPVTLILQ